MSFFDKPIVDKYSKNSEKSERKLEEFLNQQTGFICRMDQPDKGVDYDIELISNGSGASGWRFGLQLKSIERVSLILEGQFISYSLKTSRLGYLMARTPAMGIIALYAIEKDVIYFDFVDKIYERLMEERGTSEWQNNDQVNIRIPVSNELNDKSARDIYSIFRNRFEQAGIMQQSYGAKYNLPSINLNAEFQYDFNNVDHIKKMLREHGLLLLNRYDLRIVYDLIIRVPNIEISLDKDLLIIAAVSHCEVGKHPESLFYVNKLLRRNDLSKEEDHMVSFTKCKNDLALGNIDSIKFIEEMGKLRGDNLSAENDIILELNSTFFELLNIKTFHSIPNRLIDSIQSIFLRINGLTCPDITKSLLEIWNAENFSILIGNFRHKQFGELRIREALGNEFSRDEKRQRILFLSSLQNELFAIIEKLNKMANDTNNNVLKANIIALHSRIIISQEIEYIAFLFPPSNQPAHKALFENHIMLALSGYNIFLSLNDFKNAYMLLCNALELIEISRRRYHFEDDYNVSQLLDIMKQMEGELDLHEYSMIISPLIDNQYKELLSTEEEGMAYVKDMDDHELENLAKITLASFELPESHLVNLIEEMKAYRTFHRRCTDDSLDIFAFYRHERTTKNAYTEPVKFVLRSKKTGLETVASTNMDELLKVWSL